MRQRRENAGRNIVVRGAVIMTLMLIGLLIFYYVKYDRARTLRAALEKVDKAPLFFSVDSGFYEKGFVLKIGADEKIPREDSVEIRYTVDGDDPTGDSLLYKGGIDLEEVILQREAEEPQKAQELEAERAEATAAREKALAEAEAAAAAAAAAAEAGDTAAAARTAAAEDLAAAAENEAARREASPEEYSIENLKRQWEYDKDTAVSDNGVYAQRASDGIYVIPVRARLVQGEDMSDVVTQTYVIGEGVFERYDGYVACLSIDSSDLFDYDKGIMVPGSHYWKDIEDGVRADRSGNFYQEGEEWIKNGHVTLFTPDGSVLLEEDTGITVGGYSSRNLPTRTLRIEASPAKGSASNRFPLDIFESGSYSRSGNLPEMEKYSAARKGVEIAETPADPVSFGKIRFRTHGIPQYHIRSVRNEYAKKISDASGFPGLPEARLGVAFLNGEFYTICDVTPSVTKEYMCDLFGLGVPEAIEKYDTSDYNAYTQAKIVKLFEADLTQEENRKALEEAVDMDNYLFYMAMEVLFNNADWPFNNFSMWRYVGEEDPDNPYTDGRYRFILDDMDQILTNGLHGIPEDWSSELIDYMMRDKGHTFYHVMQCQRFRDTFLTYVDDLLRTTFAPDYACAVLEALYADMKREYILDYGEDFWAEMESTAQITADNIREKEELYRANIEKYMGLKERYSVTVEAGEGVSVSWNNMTVNPGGEWSGEYYRGTSFTVTAKPEEGYRFAGWEINGELLESQDASGDSGMDTQAETTLGITDTLAAAGAETGDKPALTVRAIAEPLP